MRSKLATKKDFVELFFISALFLGLTLVSSCSAMREAQEERAPAYASSLEEAPSVQLQFLRGGKIEKRN